MEDDRYIAYRLAAQKNDEDRELQSLIGEFNLARLNLSNASSGSGEDARRTEELQEKAGDLYSRIMENSNMRTYSALQEEINRILRQINAVISGTLAGQLPEEIDIEQACGGDCSSCGGQCSD